MKSKAKFVVFIIFDSFIGVKTFLLLSDHSFTSVAPPFE